MSELSALDTNVLVYAHDDLSPFQPACKALLSNRDLEFCLAPQVLAEFYAVVTSRKRVANPFSPEEALAAIDAVLAQPNIELLPVPTDIVTRWTALLEVEPVTGADVFDVQLVAVLLANDVGRLYTLNVKDFEPFEELELLTP